MNSSPIDSCSVGSIIEYGRIEYRVLHVHGQHVLVENDSQPKPQLLDRSLVRVIRHAPISVTASANPHVVSDAEWERTALRTKSVVDVPKRRTYGTGAIQQVAVANKVHVSTIYRRLLRHQDNAAITSQVRAKRSDSGQGRLEAAVEEQIDAVLREMFLSREGYSRRGCWETINDRLAAKNLKRISYGTLCQRVQRISEREQVAARQGAAVAQRRFGAVISTEPKTRPPWEKWEIDHYQIPVKLSDVLSGEDLDFLHLTLVLDAGTRMVVGWCMSFDPPNVTAIALALTHAVSDKTEWLRERGLEYDYPCYGLPDLIKVDNAKEFKSRAFSRACAEYNIKLEYRKPHRPKTGGQHVERLFASLQMELQSLPGSIVATPSGRGRNDRPTKAKLTLEAFEEWFELLILGEYHQRLHRTLMMPPIAAWTDWIADHPAHQSRDVKDLRKFTLDFLQYRDPVVTARGIQVENLTYWCDALAEFVNARDPKTRERVKISVRLDPRNITVIHAFLPGSAAYISVPVRDVEMLPTPLWMLRMILRELRQNGINRVNNHIIATARLRRQEIVQSATDQIRADRGAIGAAQLEDQDKTQTNQLPSSNRPRRKLEVEDIE
jgi:putative transposase